MSYVAITPEERAAMLARIGVSAVADLLEVIPPAVRFPSLALPGGRSEMEVARLVGGLAARNRPVGDLACFLGAGAYHHYIPSVVGHILSRSEFYTAYTPYQPEISQGTLQAIFEFQSYICELSGLEVANASVYDGASALAEAVLMALRVTGRSRVVLSGAVHPEYRAVVGTYLAGREVEVATTAVRRDQRGVEAASPAELLDERTACCVVQDPDFFGAIHDWAPLAAAARAQGALTIAVCNPVALALLRPPGAWGADIAVGDGQPCGVPLSFGGPYVGFMAARAELLRQMPGRIVGETTDAQGRRGFVLTLQAREQHIRREKATSNLCTNQALMALAMTVYLALVGPEGLRRAADLSRRHATYLARRLAQLPGYRVLTPTPRFHEVAVACPAAPRTINAALLERGILGGYELGRDYPELDDAMLLCCTEMNTRNQIDALVEALAELGRRGQ